MLEAINNGVTTINDMYFLTENIIKAASKAKINLINGPTLMDADGKGEARTTEFKRIIKKYGNKNITAGIHGLYTASEKYIKSLIPFIKQNNLPVHIHFCENKQEIKDIRKFWNIKTPSEALIKYFRNIKLILAHCVELNQQDINNLKKLDCSIVHNPTSNMYLACGVADIKKYLDNDINVCIGTDGPGSGCNGDILKELRVALLLQKIKYNNASVINSYEGLKMVTINGAKALGIEKNKGSIDVNKDADLIIINLDHLNTMMNNDTISNIVYNVNHENIETVIINGNIVKEKNKIIGFKIDSILKECKKLHTKLLK
jgi:5-methylthioadenosine/S-adenosylhomocysteine deaminase